MNELLTMLDTKYKRLEYIQSSGTQYINTGIVPKNTIKWVLDAQFTELDKAQFNGAYANNCRFDIALNIANKFYINGGNLSNFDFGDNDRHIFVLDMVNGIGKIDNQQISLSTKTLVFSNRTFLLFARQSNVVETYCYEKIYSSQIYDNGTLVRNMIPVLRKSDNEIGMLDTVEGKFYPNAGTGKFTANLDTMYTIIQGTPTVQDGRVSGFSASNYLKTAQDFPLQPTNFEINIRLKSTINNTDTRYFLATSKRTGFILGITRTSENNFIFRLYGGNADGTAADWNKASSEIIIDEKQFFDVKFTYNGTEYALYVDDTKVISYLSSNPLYCNSKITFGIWYTLNSNNLTAFSGTIDLNRSYIKIDDTKYKLQAVVGYTKVGSPTITDGVVSGFYNSPLSYIQTSGTVNFNQPFEIKVAFTTKSSGRNVVLFSYLNTANKKSGVSLNFTYWNRYVLRVYNNAGNPTEIASGNLGFTMENSASYVAYITHSNNSLTFTLKDATDTETLFTNSYDLDDFVFGEGGVLFGGIYNTQLYNPMDDGSIDLNKTYIKINNKLWFNGLPNDN